ILKEKSVDMKTKINNDKKIFNWSREQIIFIVLVFIELKLIESNNSVLTIHFNYKKKSLETTHNYQKEIKKEQVKVQLYYSGLDELKATLFGNMMQDNENNLEEITHES